MAGRVAGMVAVITGAGGAIGQAIAIRLATEGAKVALIDLEESSLKITADLIKVELDKSSIPLQDMVELSVLDITNESAVKDYIDKLASLWGRLDILVNNAAAFVFGTVEEATSEAWDKVLNVNVKGYAFGCKAAIPHMRKNGGGSIINIGSISSFVAQPKFVPYNTTKGAILQLTRCIAYDAGVDNIRCNAVCPGSIDTPATSKHAEKLGITKDELTKEMIKDHFLKKMGTTRDVANAVLFLASNESSFITGSTLMVDGGFTAH
eukprot:TRINITY_DN3677_c0_g1_i1.p1 TRINITY_DN3677_c0_g1~~TRINITY_DN3677_c0_g1_i1.p1  ORF type:complete len:265 (-),score=31.72 TRINITY_DN3677_c0_g1_i1:65-859(-)